MQYWLLKTEPSAYGIDDIKRQEIGMWDGVRNFQARNNLRAAKKGEMVFIYHSSTENIGIVGIAEVAKEAYPDPTQFDPKADHYDPSSRKEKPKWSAIDVKFKKKFKRTVTLRELKDDPYFADMILTSRGGSRLSVQPVSEKHFKRILDMVA